MLSGTDSRLSFLKDFLKALPWLFLIISGLSVLGLKLYYSKATVQGLRFVLAPLALGVELFTGERFSYVAEQGYFSLTSPVVINGSCAGINYWIILILISTFIIIYRKINKPVLTGLLLLPVSLFYMLAINTFRIVSDMKARIIMPGLYTQESGSTHLFLGTFIYFFFLIGYYILLDRVINKINQRKEG